MDVWGNMGVLKAGVGGNKKTYGVMDMFIILILVMVLQMYTDVKT